MWKQNICNCDKRGYFSRYLVVDRHHCHCSATANFTTLVTANEREDATNLAGISVTPVLFCWIAPPALIDLFTTTLLCPPTRPVNNNSYEENHWGTSKERKLP
jgi:hypothetical protein